MRQVMIVPGCSFLALMLITGCITIQIDTPFGSDNQSPSLIGTQVTTTYEVPHFSHTECNLSSADPITFQKFLPDIPGYEREFGQNISAGNNYNRNSPGRLNGIEDHYKIPGSQNTVSVSFYDLGPCATESTGVSAFLNDYYNRVYQNILTRKTSFHGYQALHTIHTIDSSSYIRRDAYSIGINNRLYVVISAYSSSDKGLLLSEAEADIEKFANAIDFNGLASTV